MKKIVTAVLSLFYGLLSSGQSMDRSAALQKIVNKTVDSRKVYGACFAVKKDGFVWEGFAGDLQAAQPFFIASTTKLFTTALVMQLRAEGKLNLEDPVYKFLPADIGQALHILNGKDHSREISVRQLLSHTSGLPDYFQDKPRGGESLETQVTRGIDQSWSFEEAIARSKKLEPHFAPGTKGKAHYSDTNFQLLGKIIEVVTGQSYEANCQARILQPLGLSQTYLYTDSTDKRPRNIYFGRRELVIPKAMASFGADGGMVSTSSDLLVFVEAFFTGKLFPRDYLDSMQEWKKIFPPIRSGMGIHLFRLPGLFGLPDLIGHSGLSGALAYCDPVHNIYIAGSVNQVAHPSASFMTMTKLLQRMLMEDRRK